LIAEKQKHNYHRRANPMIVKIAFEDPILVQQLDYVGHLFTPYDVCVLFAETVARS
jgi:hypothetical protein